MIETNVRLKPTKKNLPPARIAYSLPNGFVLPDAEMNTRQVALPRQQFSDFRDGMTDFFGNLSCQDHRNPEQLRSLNQLTNGANGRFAVGDHSGKVALNIDDQQEGVFWGNHGFCSCDEWICIYYNQAVSIKAAFPVVWDSIQIWWKDWANQFLVSLVAILLTLTVVGYPLVIFGVFEQALDLTHGIRTGILGFWQGLRKHWRQSLIWGGLNLLAVGMLGFNISFYYQIKTVLAAVLMFLTIFAALFWLTWQFYTVSCFFLQEEKKLKLAWKNGLAIILLQPGYALLVALAMLILMALSVSLLIPLFLGSLPLIAILGLRAVQRTIGQDPV